jgi:nitroreductase
LDLSVDQVLSTTRAVRRRLDLERPIERDVLRECVELALQAPNGSNRQNWHFILVDDEATKSRLAEIYGRAYDENADAAIASYDPSLPQHARLYAIKRSADHLRTNLHRVPAMLVPCQTPRPPEANAGLIQQVGYWSSVLPAVWSFMLAARERGLGTVWTTLHLMYERDAADALGVPFDDVAQGPLIPIAYTIGTHFSPAFRLPVDNVVHWNHWSPKTGAPR